MMDNLISAVHSLLPFGSTYLPLVIIALCLGVFIYAEQRKEHLQVPYAGVMASALLVLLSAIWLHNGFISPEQILTATMALFGLLLDAKLHRSTYKIWQVLGKLGGSMAICALVWLAFDLTRKGILSFIVVAWILGLPLLQTLLEAVSCIFPFANNLYPRRPDAVVSVPAWLVDLDFAVFCNNVLSCQSRSGVMDYRA